MDQSSGIAGDELGRAVQQWAAEAVVDEAARARSRARWLEIQAGEASTLAGTLLDLAERSSLLTFTVGDHQVRGAISGMGTDFVAVRRATGPPVLIPTTAIDAVRTEPGHPPVRGDREAGVTVDATLAGVVVPMAAERPDVVVHTRSPAPIRGMLRSAGTDSLQLRSGDERPTTTWIPLAAVTLLYLL